MFLSNLIWLSRRDLTSCISYSLIYPTIIRNRLRLITQVYFILSFCFISQFLFLPLLVFVYTLVHAVNKNQITPHDNISVSPCGTLFCIPLNVLDWTWWVDLSQWISTSFKLLLYGFETFYSVGFSWWISKQVERFDGNKYYATKSLNAYVYCTDFFENVFIFDTVLETVSNTVEKVW